MFLKNRILFFFLGQEKEQRTYLIIQVLYWRNTFGWSKIRPTIALWIRLCLASCRPAQGSSPKHTIFTFIIYSQNCAIFVMRKEWK